jgi:hypothetical protein
MKDRLVLILIIFIMGLNISNVASAQSTEANEQSVYAKCFVELVGGSETISFWLVKPSALKTLSTVIAGKEILLVMNAQKKGSNKKVTIYKTKQCVLDTDQFSSPRARVMDQEYLR